MKPRTRKTPQVEPVPLAVAIASNVKERREELALTQGELASKMNDIGFATWSRVTVVEAEGKGRRRIHLAELLGLCIALDSSVFDLLGGDAVELAPGGPVFERTSDILALTIPHDVTIQLLESHAEAGMRRETDRLRQIEIDRLHEVADEIRDVAGWFEDKAKALVTNEEDK